MFKNLESNNRYFFPRTMISRFNLLPHHHFHYLFLIDTLVDSCFLQRSEHLQSYAHKPCDIQGQRFVVQFVLHPQLMSSINASDAGCWFIQLTDNIFFTQPCFSADDRPNIDWQARFQTAAWKFALSMCFCKESFVGDSWWHWMFFLFIKQKESHLINLPIDGKA